MPAVSESAAIEQSEPSGDMLQDSFVYQRVNRPDPFVPFVNEQTSGSSPVAEDEEVLTGMQLFEPGQLDLVTILFSGDQAVAMVQDSTGRGHIIKPQQKIGRRGVIKDILSNVVVIEEWYLTTAGQRKYKNIEMVLRKEGDK